MVPRHRLFAVSSLVAAGFLSACATPSENVITRAWQVDYALGDMERECRFHAITDTVTNEISKRIDADQVFEELWQACPDLTLASLPDGGAETSPDIPTGLATDGQDNAAEISGNDESSGSNAGSDGSSSNTSAGESSSGESAGNGSEGGNGAGSDGDDSGSDSAGNGGGEGGSDSGGGSKSNGNGRGSSANNGGGNGSEGSSPGRGRGANLDE